MVAGAVTPPRLDLANEDLIRAHVQALWLAETGLSLGQSLKDILEERRTTVLLVRCRYHIVTHRGDTASMTQDSPLLAEDCLVLAFAGAPQSAQWLDGKRAEELLYAHPETNVSPDQAAHFLGVVINGFATIQPQLDRIAEQHGQEILEAHRRVRQASRLRNVRYTVEPHLPPDVLGVYVYLPVNGR
ncbi:MAG TPA: hypothetical protein VGX03_19000 [Candidatus Binatia bacterium]|jgi:hypothetical protein|nr:hypothetical protein [Candidatus Binatia bacterium]